MINKVRASTMLDDTTRDRSKVSYFRNLRSPVGCGVVIIITVVVVVVVVVVLGFLEEEDVDEKWWKGRGGGKGIRRRG